METNRASRARALPGRRTASAALVASSLVLALALGACSRSRAADPGPTARDDTIVARADSFMGELAGPPFATLSPVQRWKVVASIGRGLTPSGFTAADLPEPHSTGAGYVEVYCTQCHWLPTPQLHSAAEWPDLVRGMVLRMRLVQRRVRGPLLERVGREGIQPTVRYVTVPDAEQVDSIRAYLVRNALPVARPGEIPAGRRGALFEARCSVCHQTPSPKAHTAAEWKNVVPRMQENMRLARADTLTTAQMRAIEALLVSRAAPPGKGP